MPDSSHRDEPAPQSRRAAREAASRRAPTGETPIAAAPPSGPATPTPANGAGALFDQDEWHPADAGSEAGFQPVPLRTPRASAAAPVSAPPDDDPWIFAAAPSAPALPYSRTGANETVGAAAATASAGAGAPAARPGGARGATATLDDLFSGQTSTDDIGSTPPPPNKRRRRVGGWIALSIVLVVLGGIAAGGWYVWSTYEEQIREVLGIEEPKDYDEGLANGEVLVAVEAGDTGMPISQRLYDSGVTMMPDAFYDYLISTGQNPNFQPGVYALQYQMTSEAALTALMDPANRREHTAQIPEGFTVDGTLERLAEGTGIALEEFQAAAADPASFGVPADSLEGWLFPATYTFDPSATAPQIIQTLVDRTVQSLDAAGVPVDDRQRVLTTASIIQREARYVDDMRKVATVIQNRLNPDNQETHGLLQMDSTAQYGYGELHAGSASTSEEAQYDDNPWNTYVHTGLPIGPIANPGDDAISAVMNPEPGPWLYFVTVNLDTGETIFTSTYDEHLGYVRQMQDWCSQNPDSGC